MAKNKYCVKEYAPTANMPGYHGYYAAAVIDNTITNAELARKIHDVGSISSDMEIEAILKLAARVILSEVKENNRVQLDTGDGVLVTISPKCQGSISDKDVLANPDKYPGKTAAEEDMLTPDMLRWSLKAEVGLKYSQQFAQQKQAQKVKVANTANIVDADELPAGGEENGENGGNGGNGGENEE